MYHDSGRSGSPSVKDHDVTCYSKARKQAASTRATQNQPRWAPLLLSSHAVLQIPYPFQYAQSPLCWCPRLVRNLVPPAISPQKPEWIG